MKTWYLKYINYIHEYYMACMTKNVISEWTLWIACFVDFEDWIFIDSERGDKLHIAYHDDIAYGQQYGHFGTLL